MAEKTKVWFNDANGHHFAVGPDGMTLNGEKCNVVPAWVDIRTAPDAVYGPVIQWDGGDCPVDPNTLVRCVFRGRRPYIGTAIFEGFSATARAAMWHHAPHGVRTDPNMDITGYQVRVD